MRLSSYQNSYSVLFIVLTLLYSSQCLCSAGADFDGAMPSLNLQLKHAHVPEIALVSNLFFEALLFVFCTMALGMQYINLYKTVWWLPHSNAKYALVGGALNFLYKPCSQIFLQSRIST